MRTYKGKRLHYRENDYGYGSQLTKRGDCLVTVNDETLLSVNSNGDIAQRFEWGNKTSMSRNLAESILTDYIQHISDIEYNQIQVPEELVLAFLNEVIISLPFETWEIPMFQVEDVINSFRTFEEKLNEFEVDEEMKELMGAYLEKISNEE
jgi:hypothetical protein